MIRQWIARLNDDDNPRLHRVPFMLIWVAAYGIGWIMAIMGGMLIDSMLRETFDYYPDIWLISLVVGVGLGATLALVQGWILRRRYGFVPKFWRTATILGMAVATYFFFTIMDNYIWDGIAVAGSVWLGTLALFQAIVLFRMNRQAWMLLAVAAIAALTGSALEFLLQNSNNYGTEVIWAIIAGSAIQAIGTGLVMLRLMANPRDGIVPKRDADVKTKDRMRRGLHPVTFIGFWAASLLTAWGSVMLIAIIFVLLFEQVEIVERIIEWIDYNAEWAFGLMIGALAGVVASTGQRWLMKQHSDTDFRYWVPVSTLGWTLGGLGLFYYMDNYNGSQFEYLISLLVFFGIPAAFQMFLLSRTLRGGWVWLATGAASAIVAVLIHFQFEWTHNEQIYAIVFGSIASAIISGSTFVLLQAQNSRTETVSDTDSTA